MSARTRTRVAGSTLTAALLAAGLALAGPAGASTSPSLDEILYEGPVNELLMPVGDVFELVDPTAADEQHGTDEALTAPAGEGNVTEIPAPEPPAKKKRHAKR